MKHLLIAAAAFASLSVPALAQDSDYQETSASHDYGYASYGDRGGRSYGSWSSYSASRGYAYDGYADDGGYPGYSRQAYGPGYSNRYGRSRGASARGDGRWRDARRYRYRHHGCGCSGYRDDDPD